MDPRPSADNIGFRRVTTYSLVTTASIQAAAAAATTTLKKQSNYKS